MSVSDFYDLYWGDDKPHRHTDGTYTPYTGDGPSPYGLGALRDETTHVATAGEGTRNDTLNRAAFNLYQLVASGHLEAETVQIELTRAATACGLPEHEIASTLRSAAAAGTQKPRHVDPLDPLPNVHVLHPRATPPADPPPHSGQTDSPDEEPQSDEARDDEARQRYAQWRAQQVSYEVERLRNRREAERIIVAEEAAATWREPVWRSTLTDELAVPDEPVTYLVDDVLPAGGNVLIPAQFKSGKTTLVNNLAKALADGEKFLGRFATHLERGRIALWNYEVDERQYRRWLREAGFKNTEAVTVLNLRGFRMPMIHQRIEDWIVDWLTVHEITCWFVDPFARAFVGSGKSENDNTEVGTFLDTLDVIKERAGVSELILPTHTGRAEMEQGAERARGATRLDDWADVRWLLTKDDQDVRYFRATGRDVEVPEERLDFDADTRLLRLGGGDRTWEKRRRLQQIVVDAVHETPGITLRGLRDAVRAGGGKGRNDVIDSAVAAAEQDLQILVERTGDRTPSRHYPARNLTPWEPR